MLSSILDFLSQTISYKSLNTAIQNNKIISVCEIAEGQYSFIASLLAYKEKRDVLLVSTTDIKASKLAKEIEILSGKHCMALSSRDKQFSRMASSQESTWDRISALVSLINNEANIVSASIESICDVQIPPSNLKSACFTINKGDEVNPLDLIERLVSLGYERVNMVEGKGQCALRGDILDLFSPDKASAARIEFFDNEIDTIRSFDCISQRSIKSLESYYICPASECVLSLKGCKTASERLLKAINEPQEINLSEELIPLIVDDIFDNAEYSKEDNFNKTKQRVQAEAEALRDGIPPAHVQTWLNIIYENKCYIEDYLNNPIIILIEPDFLRQRQESTQREYETSFEEALVNGFAFNAQRNLIGTYSDVFNRINNSTYTKLLFSNLQRGLGMFKPKQIVSIGSVAISTYGSQLKLLEKDLNRYIGEGYDCFIFAGGETRAQRLEKTLRAMNIPCKNNSSYNKKYINILPYTLNTGFISTEEKILVLSDADIYGTSYKKIKKKYESSEKIASYTELFDGDYVVHESYGIGVFKGIESIERNGSTQEYLIIAYAGDDKLYVPTDQFDRVQKFASSQSTQPHINKLGGTEWKKKKSRVKSGLKEIAFNLLELYAQRQQNQGFAFSKENPWELEFNDDFPYELTSDQEKCINDIFDDMQRHRNMDRLLCGDVGYGKTELALRAAFKAVSDSKQVAILAPTTILVQQHYQTLLKRFSKFPINCEMLSRFKTPTEQKKIISSLAEGKIDIVVGTHKLLSKNIVFKNLGLLIVDEEQRFGVGHKEIIKNLKKNIDVLTLSATPIPRTLYMSMIGVRDISLIETPPEDRLSVKTYVVEYNDNIIRDAINRELNRGGQVYFLFNRVENIDKMSEKLRALVPEARIGIAHGQMKESHLEKTMLNFYAGSYDILLCTTIIENGLDVPEANTIIIFDADKFGLSQLYQLRGRVGRSSRQAYAYFTIKPNYSISEVAQKRLLAIKEFTEFGAGYRIAMRDLEIRGAGNMFGPEQSGHLSEVGFDMYLKLIEQALNDVQGKPVSPDDIDTRVDLPLDSYLPKSYVASEKERIEIYKRIAMIKDSESRMDIEEELTDRYGNMPLEVENLTMIAHSRAYTRRLFITLFKQKDDKLFMAMDIKRIANLGLLVQAISNADKRLYLNQSRPYGMVFKFTGLELRQAISQLIPILEKICEYIETNQINKENVHEKEKSN